MHATFLEWSGHPAPGLAGWTAFEDGWTIVPHRVGETTVGLAAMRGTEMHYALSPLHRRRALTRKTIREFLAPLFEHRGYLTTSAYSGACTAFIERLGFQHTWKDGRVDHYMLTALPFGRKDI